MLLFLAAGILIADDVGTKTRTNIVFFFLDMIVVGRSILLFRLILGWLISARCCGCCSCSCFGCCGLDDTVSLLMLT
jgi:hypothetical protein